MFKSNGRKSVKYQGLQYSQNSSLFDWRILCNLLLLAQFTIIGKQNNTCINRC